MKHLQPASTCAPLCTLAAKVAGSRPFLRDRSLGHSPFFFLVFSLLLSSGTLAFFGVGLWPSLSLGLDVWDSIISLWLVVVLGVFGEFPTLLPSYLDRSFHLVPDDSKERQRKPF